MATRIPQRRLRDLAVLLWIALLSAPTAADMTPRVAVELPDLNATELAWAEDPRLIPGPLRLGFGRRVPVAPALETLLPSRWQQTPDGGHLLSVEVRSPDARGLRIAVEVAAMPDAALLGFFGATGMTVAVFSGAELNAAHGTFWSPLIQDESAVVTINLPPGCDPAATFIILPQVSHLVRWPFDDTDMPDSAGNPCRMDVTCHPDWERISRATALLVYTDDAGGTGTCTGTLLRDADPTTEVPYILTASHCVPDQNRAASIETVWFHQGTRCGSNDEASVQSVSGGAVLLHTDAVTDISLMRLSETPPGARCMRIFSFLPLRGSRGRENRTSTIIYLQSS
jgi:lysyl endopeptidase